MRMAPCVDVDDAYRAGAVVHAPGGVERRPRPFDVALVRVDHRCVQRHAFWQFLEHSCQKLPHGLRHVPFGSFVPEHVALPVAVPQAQVRVPAAAVFLVVPLGHKRGGQSHLVADLFDAVLEEHGSSLRR